MGDLQPISSSAGAKAPWESRTVLLNVIVALAGVLSMLGIVPAVGVWIQSHTDLMLTGLGALGVVLRLVTKDKISIE